MRFKALIDRLLSSEEANAEGGESFAHERDEEVGEEEEEEEEEEEDVLGEDDGAPLNGLGGPDEEMEDALLASDDHVQVMNKKVCDASNADCIGYQQLFRKGF